MVTAFNVLEELRVTWLVILLFLIGAFALVMGGRLQARPLAKQLLAPRKPST
jgi:hypothetical protein